MVESMCMVSIGITYPERSVKINVNHVKYVQRVTEYLFVNLMCTF